jgi:hypothetical protein
VAQLAELKERVGHGGASLRAADYILQTLSAQQKGALRTHYPFAARAGSARDAA